VLSGEEIRILNIKAYNNIQNILLGTSKKEENKNDEININILHSMIQETNQVYNRISNMYITTNGTSTPCMSLG
jgi:hypothetical protein